ncbi:peptidoglycan bridge formation glycyltransferase FemA/FemB family protein [Faecalicoccus pleomorphus]|nr:peptidoglycan bridge formation glycyltransferase FemA/FemB family protein [Faecalicoccus pleomorphus]
MKDYQFHTEVSKEEFDRFVQNHRFCNLLQSYDWAKVKSN